MKSRSRGRSLLVVDIGNTDMTMGVFLGERLRATARASTARRSADETALLISSLLGQKGISTSDLSGAAIASVVPDATSGVKSAMLNFVPHVLDVDDPAVRAPVPVEYKPPVSVGADRIANAAAAHELYASGKPKIVVDFGTATTFDCVSPSGVYLGGAIHPGIEISIRSLFERTARLPRIAFVPAQSAVGKDTHGSIRAGLFFGIVGAVKEILSVMEREIGRVVRIGTGGLAPVVCPTVGGFVAIDVDLTLKGIKILFDKFHARSAKPAHRPGR